jgi:phosphoribosyl 1,2-cyclic phosphodiesterase
MTLLNEPVTGHVLFLTVSNMDYMKKASPEYKKLIADRVLDTGFKGDCSRLRPVPRVARGNGDDVFSGATGISIAGEETNIAIPSLGLTIDCGKRCDQFLERDLVISHFDDDHVEGVGKAMCKAINTGEKLDIMMPSMEQHPDLKETISIFKKQDINGMVTIHEMKNGTKVDRDDKIIEAFDVFHAPESRGFVVWKKHSNGKPVQELTYTGDINPSRMDMTIPQITGSKTLVIDGSYSGSFLPALEPLLDIFTNHASTREIQKIFDAKNDIKNIGIVHLPRALCFDIENDILANFSGSGKNVYFLDNCTGSRTIDPAGDAATFKKIV